MLASVIWKTIKEYFSKQGGIEKFTALTTFMKFQYRPELSILENTNHFKRLKYKLEVLCSHTPPSKGGSNHFLCITNEASKYRKVYFDKTKDETAEVTHHYIL